MHHAGVWVELTNLVIPGVGPAANDDMLMIRRMCRWIADNGLSDHPLHFSRFFPRYKLQHVPPTPIATLEKARRVALEEGMRHVYLGNVK
jgi:pyruvate formate lyase activating enzyme